MTTFGNRTTTTYDPTQDQTERHPEWRIGPCKMLPSGELVVSRLRLFRFSLAAWEADEEWCRAHALAHIDLADAESPAFVDCEMADALTAIRLDREGSRQ